MSRDPVPAPITDARGSTSILRSLTTPRGRALEHARDGDCRRPQSHGHQSHLAHVRAAAASERDVPASNDPLHVENVRDIVGLYLDPPAHAAMFCVDEKPQIQALDRTQPLLPMLPG